MKPTATGRVLFWRGGSLWIGLAGEPTGVHAHHAIQITLPFAPGRVRLLHHGGDWRDYAAAIVAADEAHAFEARGQHVAQIFVEPESREGRLLQQLYRDARLSEPSSGALESHAAALAKGFLDRADDAALIARAQHTVAALAGTAPASMDPIDARIARAVKLIRERLGGTVPLREIADAVRRAMFGSTMNFVFQGAIVDPVLKTIIEFRDEMRDFRTETCATLGQHSHRLNVIEASVASLAHHARNPSAEGFSNSLQVRSGGLVAAGSNSSTGLPSGSSN